MLSRVTAIALISDLHANLVALDAVLADIRAASVDLTVCLGDIVDLGPDPRATVERLHEQGVTCVRGNHDGLDEHPTLPLLALVEDWTRDQLDDSYRRFLNELPSEITLDLDGATLLCVHGSPRSHHDSILASTPAAELDAWLGDRSFDVLACGHTHVPLTRLHATRWLVNVGSVGMPFAEPFSGGPPRVLKYCDYAIVRSRRSSGGTTELYVEHRRIPLDFEAFCESMRRSSIPQADTWIAHWG